jgi:hypothetical protein
MAVTATTILSTVTLIKDSMMNPFVPVEASDGTLPYVFSISSVLPEGLTFNTSSGVISGIPTQLASLVDYNITVVDANTDAYVSGFQLIVQSEIIPYLKRITEATEQISIASTTTGVRTYGAYDWIKPLEMISWYSQGLGLNSISTASTIQLVNIINSLTNNVSKFE